MFYDKPRNLPATERTVELNAELCQERCQGQLLKDESRMLAMIESSNYSKLRHEIWGHQWFCIVLYDSYGFSFLLWVGHFPGVDGCAHFTFWPDGGCLLSGAEAVLQAAPIKYSATVTGPKYCQAAIEKAAAVVEESKVEAAGVHEEPRIEVGFCIGFVRFGKKNLGNPPNQNQRLKTKNHQTWLTNMPKPKYTGLYDVNNMHTGVCLCTVYVCLCFRMPHEVIN